MGPALRSSEARHGPGGLAAAGALLALLAVVPVGAETPTDAPCRAWPGEPSPLPTTGDPDPVLRRYAALRVRELFDAARSLEATRPLDTRRLVLHARCLLAEDGELEGVLARTTPVRLTHPRRVFAAPGGSREGFPSELAPWLEARIEELAAAPPAPRPRPRPAAPPGRPDAARIASLEREVERAEVLLREARFEEAEEAALRLRGPLSRLGSDPAVRALRVRAELAAATAQLALGRRDEARASLGHALDADPGLELDPIRTPPKVRRALEAVRRARAGGAS